MASRITKEVLYLKREYTTDELLQMGNELALARVRMEEIKAEEEVMKAQIKDRKAGVEQTIGSLSRNVLNKYEMVNVDCIPIWDSPNVGEVTLVRKDTGEIAKIRVMTEVERQMDLPLETPKQVEEAVEESVQNIAKFFDKDEPEPAQENVADLEEPTDPFTDPNPAAAKEAIKPEHDSEFEAPIVEAKPKAGRKPKGFSGPTNPSAIADDDLPF